MDQLTGAVRDRQQEDAQAQDELISQLDYPTYSRILNVMQMAQDINAIGSWVRVNASPSRDLLTLSFGLSHVREYAYNPPQAANPTGYMLEIIIRPLPEARVRDDTFRPFEWSPDESAEDIGHKIATYIQRRGYLNERSDFDWSLALRNLTKSLTVAVSSQRRDPGAWRLRGKLCELLNDEWAVTTAGLEHRPDPSFILPRVDFYQSIAPSPDRRSREQILDSLINGSVRPDWCSLDDWRWLVERAQDHY